MRKILKAPHNLVRRVLSKTSNISRSSSHDRIQNLKKESLMSEEREIGKEIQALKYQIENLKAAISTLRDRIEKKEIAIANIAREKEKITMELLKLRRSNNNLLKQLEDERTFYYKEKETYCNEMNQFKRLKRALSNASTSKNDVISAEIYKKEIAKIKQTLNQTLEANYNLSIKFLRMKNTKTCLKTELKTMQLEHEKLVNDYKAKISNLSEELDDIIQERLHTPISCSSKKYLHLVKQNSCLVYENLCLQLEVDSLRMKCEKLKLDKTKSETNSRLKYIKHESAKSKHHEKSTEREHEQKRVRIKEEKPEKLEKDLANPSTSQRAPNEETLKIFERRHLPGIPDIKLLHDFETPTTRATFQDDLKQKETLLMKNILQEPNSKLALFQVSNISSGTSTFTNRSLVRTRSSPEIARPSSDWNVNIH